MVQAVTITGTHEGEFMGIPPTRRKIRVHGIVMSRFQCGRIVEEWEVIDQHSFLEQLPTEDGYREILMAGSELFVSGQTSDLLLKPI